MASGFYTLQGNIIRNISRCIKHSTLNTTPCKVRWRSISTLTFNGFVDDTYPEVKKQENASVTLDRYTLKQKEKGDWRNLTFQEKQALYQLSFSHPFCEVEHSDDEWKLILAGTFTAMGLMILGLYMFVFSSEPTEKAIGPLSAKILSKEKEMEDSLKDKNA